MSHLQDTAGAPRKPFRLIQERLYLKKWNDDNGCPPTASKRLSLLNPHPETHDRTILERDDLASTLAEDDI